MSNTLTLHRPSEVAPRLGVSKNLLKTLARQKKIPCVRLTGRREIRFADDHVQVIHEYLLRHGHGRAAPAMTEEGKQDHMPDVERLPDPLAAAAALLADVRSTRGAA